MASRVLWLLNSAGSLWKYRLALLWFPCGGIYVARWNIQQVDLLLARTVRMSVDSVWLFEVPFDLLHGLQKHQSTWCGKHPTSNKNNYPWHSGPDRSYHVPKSMQTKGSCGVHDTAARFGCSLCLIDDYWRHLISDHCMNLEMCCSKLQKSKATPGSSRGYGWFFNCAFVEPFCKV